MGAVAVAFSLGTINGMWTGAAIVLVDHVL